MDNLSINLTNLRMRIRSVNAKILNLERRYGKDSTITKRAYDTINRIYGTEGKTRYTLTGSEQFRDLQKISRGVSKVEHSLYSSKAGREELRRRYVSNLSGDQKVDEAVAENLLYVFENATDWDKVREMVGKGKSDVIVNAMANEIQNDRNTQQIIDIVDSYMHRPQDQQDIDFLDYFWDALDALDKLPG